MDNIYTFSEELDRLENSLMTLRASYLDNKITEEQLREYVSLELFVANIDKTLSDKLYFQYAS